MRSERRTLAIAMAFIMCIAGTMILSLESDAEQEYDSSLGSFWSYTVQFIFDGSQAQSIEWDFGDGSDISTEWNPKNTFPDRGTYYVTQTVTNTLGSSTTVYKVEIMGFPYITLVYNNGSEDGTIQQTAYKVAAEQPEDPVRDGYSFIGWFTDVDCTVEYDWSSNVTSPVTLYAGWSKVKVYHQVSFDVDGGSVDVASESIVHGGTFTFPAYSGVKEGYDFAGWKVGDVAYSAGDTIEVPSDITVKAVWTIRQYTVIFDSGIDAQTVDHGQKAIRPEDPVRAGYKFVRWTLDGSEYDFDTPIIGNISLVAEWDAITYTVTFDSNGGSSVVSQIVNYGGKAVAPSDPTRSGYTFVRWALNGSAFDFDTILTGDITLVAVWNANSTVVPSDTYYTVTFDSNGGSDVSSKRVIEGGKVTEPDDPVREGYTFIGWFIDGTEYDFSSVVRSNITLVAQWDAITYTVAFDTDGGSAVDLQTVPHGGKVSMPQDPVKEGYTFAGWFIGDSEYDPDAVVTADINITAHWTENEPTDPEGGDDGPEDMDEGGNVTVVLVFLFIVIALAVIGVTSVRL